MLTLINGDELIDEVKEFLFFTNGDQCVLDCILETKVKKKVCFASLLRFKWTMISWNSTEYAATDLVCLRRSNLSRAFMLEVPDRSNRGSF